MTQFGRVLAGFGRAVQRFDSAGDDELHSVVIDVEGWRTLRGIQRAEAAAGSSANVDESASLLKGFGDQVNCACDLRQGGFYGGGNFRVLRIDDAGDFERGFLVEIPGGAIGLFGGQVA